MPVHCELVDGGCALQGERTDVPSRESSAKSRSAWSSASQMGCVPAAGTQQLQQTLRALPGPMARATVRTPEQGGLGGVRPVAVRSGPACCWQGQHQHRIAAPVRASCAGRPRVRATTPSDTAVPERWCSFWIRQFTERASLHLPPAYTTPGHRTHEGDDVRARRPLSKFVLVGVAEQLAATCGSFPLGGAIKMARAVRHAVSVARVGQRRVSAAGQELEAG